jgi:hypothetical protein
VFFVVIYYYIIAVLNIFVAKRKINCSFSSIIFSLIIIGLFVLLVDVCFENIMLFIVNKQYFIGKIKVQMFFMLFPPVKAIRVV